MRPSNVTKHALTLTPSSVGAAQISHSDQLGDRGVAGVVGDTKVWTTTLETGTYERHRRQRPSARGPVNQDIAQSTERD